jgi:cytochrome c biogenesis protein CcdA
VGGALPTVLGLAAIDALNPATIAVAVYLVTAGYRAAFVQAFVAGVFTTYFVGGAILVLGPTTALRDELQDSAAGFHGSVELGLGTALLAGAWWFWHTRGREPEQHAPGPSLSGLSAFMLGGFVTLVDLPTAVPYLGAIAVTVRADLEPGTELGMLGIFNTVYVVPLIVIAVVEALLGSASHGPLLAVKERIGRVAPTVLAALCLAGGAFMVADGAAALR